MSRKVILTVVALVLAATLSSIVISCKLSNLAQLVTYTNEANEFSIDYPQGWDIVTDVVGIHGACNIWEHKLATEKVGVQVARYSEASAHDHFSTSQLNEAVGSAESFSALLIKTLTDDYQDYAPVSTEELTVNGVPAIKHTFTGSVNIRLAFGVPDTVSYKWVQVYLVQDEVGWLLHFSSPEEEFDSHEATFDIMLNSFRLLK